jgi:hypothetical protein
MIQSQRERHAENDEKKRHAENAKKESHTKNNERKSHMDSTPYASSFNASGISYIIDIMWANYCYHGNEI